jgi:hypothetical protein
VRDRVAAEIELLGACPPADKALDLPRLRRLVENWPTEGWETVEVVGAYRHALLRAISAGHFLRQATSSGGPRLVETAPQPYGTSAVLGHAKVRTNSGNDKHSP